MFTKLFAIFAIMAVAFAAPSPKTSPQYLTYSTGLDYVYPGGGIPSLVSPYSNVAPISPVAYSALPANTFYLR